MIKVTVELIPFGLGKPKTLGVLEIANDCTGTPQLGNYTGSLDAEYCKGRAGTVRQFNRSKQSVWSLVGAFLKLYGHTRHSPKLMEKT